MAARALFPTYYDEETRIWSGMKKSPFYHPDCSLGEIYFTAMKNWPNHVIQVSHEDGREITNLEMRQLAIRLALFFKKEKLTHEDIVGIIGSTSTYVTAVAMACFFNTTPFHAVNVTKDAEVVKSLYAVTKPKIMFCDGSDYERIKEITKEWAPKLVTLTGHVDGAINIEELLKPTTEEYFYQPVALAVNGDQTAVILCSSGTSGFPKAVLLSHKQMTAVASFINSTDIILTQAAIDWATGCISVIGSILYGAKKVIFDGPFNAENFIKMIQKYKVTTICLAPWQTFELFNHPSATEEAFSTIKVVFITGGWISVKVLQRGQSLVKRGIIINSYGCTETGGITANIDHSSNVNNNNVGRIFPGLRVKVVNDEGKHLPHNEIGEVLIDIGANWKGYAGNPEDTAATIQDGWTNLGDLGFFDTDNNLHLVDRKKDLLKYKSCHYWPNELEQIIAELPEVLNVCVVGIHDPRYGDAAGALVVKRPGIEITEKTIIDHVAKRVVVDYKQLHSGVKFVDTLPQNTNGKVMRSVARQDLVALIN